MKGRIKKQMNRLWEATEEVRIFPGHWDAKDEVLKPAKPINGKACAACWLARIMAALKRKTGSGAGTSRGARSSTPAGAIISSSCMSLIRWNI